MLTTPRHILTMTLTKTQTKTKTKIGGNFQEEESNHVYRLTCSVQHYIFTDKQAHKITFGKDKNKDKGKDKDKEKDKDKVLKRPNMCYIFEKQKVQGFQI